MRKPYSRPILSRLLDFIAGLVLLGSGLIIVVSLADSATEHTLQNLTGLVSGAGGVVVAIIYVAVGQVVDYLGRSAYYSESCAIALEKIATTGAGTGVVPNFTTGPAFHGPSSTDPRKISSARPGMQDRIRAGARYYYIDEHNNQEGPFSREDLRDFHTSGIIADETRVCKEDDSDWGTYQDLK